MTGLLHGKSLAPGKRPLTRRPPGLEAGGTAPVMEQPPSGNEAIQRKQVGPGFGSPIPPVAEIRASLVEPGPVQREGADAPMSRAAGNVQAIASAGLDGGGAALPHAKTIQRAFGRHDLSDVRTHVGGAAATASAGWVPKHMRPEIKSPLPRRRTCIPLPTRPRTSCSNVPARSRSRV